MVFPATGAGTGFEIPSDYGFVGLGIVAYIGLSIFKILGVVAVRKKYKVNYPILYAKIGDGLIKTEAELMEYNCTQRAHQNTLETAPAFLATLLFSGLVYPRAATVSFLLWIVQRIFYFKGYSKGKPKERRNMSKLGDVSMLALIVLTLLASVGIITGSGAFF